MIVTAETKVTQIAATNATQEVLFTKSGANNSKVAVAAGTEAETINKAEDINKAQPAIKPNFAPNILLTQV